MSGPSQILVDNLPLIQRIIRALCGRRGMSPDDVEEFSAEVNARLIENDYARIRAFQGRSSFATYMAAVIQHILLDYRNREWGKWRCSAEAERLGDAAVELERLLYRDGRPLEEAVLAVLAAHPGETRAGLERLAGVIPRRTRVRLVDLEAASSVAAPGEVDAERTDVATQVSSAVRACIERLPEQDQTLLQLHYGSEMTVAQIARSMRVDPQRLYQRLYAVYRGLRKELEASGVRAADVADLIGRTELLDFELKSGGVRPSQEGKSTVAGREEEGSS